LAEQVKIGVYEAGGFPLEFPVMSLGETLLRPTAMLYRNLASMDVEESIRGNPIDGVVLLMGCDKTTPSLIMGAASVDLPTIGVSGGPMLNGKWRGQELGSGTGMWSMSEQVRAGTLKLADFFEAESCMHRIHHGLHGRSLGRGIAWQCGLPSRGRPTQCAGSHGGSTHRRHGAHRPKTLAHPHPRGF
jgi:dihydroxy-acid dehydratase